MAFIMVYITNPDEKTAMHIVSELLRKKLVSCGNIFPIRSMFYWKGEVKDESEVVAILKTKPENWSKVKSAVKKLHPYEVPAIIRIDAEADESFESWIFDATKDQK